MTLDDRIQKIEEFVHLQRYLHGRRFRVVEDPDREDSFVIEFAEAYDRQLYILRHRLRLNDMLHIRCKAQKVIKYQKPKRNGKNHN